MTSRPSPQHDERPPVTEQHDPALKPEYFEAWFHCAEPPDPIPQQFAVVTPCNPFGRPLSDNQNAARVAQLAAQLTERGISHFRADGGSRDGLHLEAGFGIIGLTLTELRALGTQFGQDALFWVESDQVYLVSCPTGERRPLGRWSERQAGGSDKNARALAIRGAQSKRNQRP